MRLWLGESRRVRAGRQKSRLCCYAYYARVTRVIPERAIERGELARDLDVELANDAVGGLIYWRMVVLGQNLSDAQLDELARFIVAGLRAAP